MPALNSAILAAGATAIALPLGTVLAVLLARFDLPGRRLAAALVVGLLLVPLYVQLCGWDAALGKLGWYSIHSATLARPWLDGLRGAIFVHGVAAVPWVTAIVGVGLWQARREEEEAALLVVPPRSVLWRVTLPHLRPFLVSAAIWTTVMTTSDITVTNVYLIDPRDQTYTESFYMALALSTDPGHAAFAALPGMVGLLGLLLGSLVVTRTLAQRPAVPAMRPTASFEAGAWKPLLSVALWLPIVFLVGIPLVSLVLKSGFVVVTTGTTRSPSWSLAGFFEQWFHAPGRFAWEITGTAAVATGAATMALAVALPIAWRARQEGRWSLLAAAITALLLAIPGPLVGLLLARLLNHDLPPSLSLSAAGGKSWLLFLYDETPLAPLLAQALRVLPLAILLLWQCFATLDPDVLAAAALDGARPRQVFQRIAVPQRWRQILAVWLIGWAVAAGDLAWSHVVTPPGLDLLSRRLFGLVHSGVEEQVAAACLWILVVYAVLAGTVLMLLRPRTPARNLG